MARKFTAAERTAIAVRMRHYWAKKRKEKPQPYTSPAPTQHAMTVRVLCQKEGLTRDLYEIDTWGELVDILTTKYPGIHIYEVLVTVS